MPICSEPNSAGAVYGAGVDWLDAHRRSLRPAWSAAGGHWRDREPRFQVGLRWRPIDDFNMDLIYGRNIYGENANWITLATTVRFHVGQ